MSDHPDIPDVVQQNAPWLLVILTTAWSVVLRWLFGRALKTVDHMSEDIAEIKERLAHIEGHLGIPQHYD